MIPAMGDSDCLVSQDFYGPVGATCQDHVKRIPHTLVRKPVEEAREILGQACDFYRAAFVFNAPVSLVQARAPVTESTNPKDVRVFLEGTKQTNPKDRVGSRKVGTSLMPQRVVTETGLAFLEGAVKGYGPFNWRDAGVRASVYYDAAVARHLAAWWEGEDTDPDSGLSHITKAIAGLMILRDGMIEGNWTDDRPPASEPGWVQQLNNAAGALMDRYGKDDR